MLSIDFNLFDHNFCESTIYSNGPHPEYMNTISSLFITFIGLNGLRKPYISLLLALTYSCLSVNGILSFMYHYYNSIGYGLLDRMSMVLLALNTTYIFVNNIKKIPLYKNNKYQSFYNIVTNLTIITYYTILLTTAGLHKEILFNTLFALFLVSIIIFMFIIKLFAKELCISNNIMDIGWKGVRYIVCSGIFWLTTEGLCHHFGFIKYLFGHVWWHIFVSYGGYLVSLVPQYINLLSKIDDEMIFINYDIFGIPYLDYSHGHGSIV